MTKVYKLPPWPKNIVVDGDDLRYFMDKLKQCRTPAARQKINNQIAIIRDAIDHNRNAPRHN